MGALEAPFKASLPVIANFYNVKSVPSGDSNLNAS